MLLVLIYSTGAGENRKLDRLDQSVRELLAIGSQSCQAADCHRREMFHYQICELQWQSEDRQIWLLKWYAALALIGSFYDTLVESAIFPGILPERSLESNFKRNT